jgi:hypothetical protein
MKNELKKQQGFSAFQILRSDQRMVRPLIYRKTRIIKNEKRAMFLPAFFAALAAGEVKEDARSDAGKEKARQDHTQRIPATIPAARPSVKAKPTRSTIVQSITFAVLFSIDPPFDEDTARSREISEGAGAAIQRSHGSLRRR